MLRGGRGRLGVGRCLAREHGGDPFDQVGDEGGAPGGPGGRPGGEGVRLGEGVQQFEGALGADGLGDGPHGGGVVEVAPGGGLHEQQVVAYERGDHGDVARVEADTGGHVPGDDLAGHRVVAGPALADVVQQGGDEQQVGAADPAGEGGGAYGGLDEVPVHGPQVHGVALRAAAHPVPVGEQQADQALGLQRLPDVDGGAAGAQQGEELLPGLGGPGRGQGAGAGGHAADGVQGERESGLGGGGRGAEREHGVAVGARGAGEHHLAVLLDDPFGERGAFGCRFPAAQHGAQPRPYGAGAQDTADLAPGDVARVGDDPGGLVDLAQQGVGVEEAEFGGDLVLFLEGEPVGGASGAQVEGVAYVEEAAAGLGESLARGVGEPGGGHRAQGGGVAQSAARLLEVGFQEVLQLALAFGAFLAQLPQGGQPLGGLVAPVGEHGGAQGGGEAEVAGDVPGVQQAELDLEVLTGCPAGLRRGADGVVEGEAEVPDRVPEAVGEGGHGLGALPSCSRSRSRSLRGESSARP